MCAQSSKGEVRKATLWQWLSKHKIAEGRMRRIRRLSRGWPKVVLQNVVVLECVKTRAGFAARFIRTVVTGDDSFGSHNRFQTGDRANQS